MQDSRPEIARAKGWRKKNKIKTGVAYSVPLTPRIKKSKKKERMSDGDFFSTISEALVPLHRAFNGVFLPAIFNSGNVPSSLPYFLLVLSNRLFLLNFFLSSIFLSRLQLSSNPRETQRLQRSTFKTC